MKAAVLFIAIFALALLIIPMISLSLNVTTPEIKTPTPVHSPSMPTAASSQIAEPSALPPPIQQVQEAAEYADYDDKETEIDFSDNGVASFLVLDKSTGKVNEVPVRDFVRGAVASEMPAGFHSEALKAQAVAAHTYALRSHYMQAANPDPKLKGADFEADPKNMKVYTSEAVAKKFYGDKADLYWDKICEAVDSVADYIMEYDGEPIVAAYHAISGGMTENAANVWSGSAPYLLPASSDGDFLAPGYESVTKIAATSVRNTLLAAYPDMELSDDPGEWFSNIEYSGSGYITAAEIGGETLHGSNIRTLFDLRSHNMDIGYDKGSFTFTVYGYGHGVGLSQYGADYLARQGYSFEDILHNYYSGVELKQVDIG